MIKFAGILLILFAGTMIGFLQAAKFAARPRQIRQVLHALQRLETEISYGQTPLAEALSRISELVPVPMSRIFADISRSLRPEASGAGETVSECWQRAVNAGWPSTAMKEAEREAFLRLGATLGGSGREEQLKHIRLAMLQLQAEETTAREDQQRYEKLSRSLGVLGAALVVILLI
ncbi:stage III sporulation protein AB [Cohnella kolymensis]|uniref:Stage III sporulation protein AB n=1 Tax=Cohnella kolymensis TaxID=1590652 RepID=A0ABR4ZZT7_9BACL|nr:stage III sporulation protein SpoIIIAB [Cohnella kolymensis]KIL34331.1 stage III sporulation protein AB [Cohnella kolymensis]